MVQLVKNLPASAGDARDPGLIPRSGGLPGEGHVNPRQYSCLGNPLDRGAWRATSLWSHKESDTTAHLSKNAPGLQYTKLGAFWLQLLKLISLQAEEQPCQVPSALP